MPDPDTTVTITTPDPADTLTASQGIRKLVQRQWDWDLYEFAKALGKPPTDVWVREQFVYFTRAGDTLRHLAPDVLSAVLKE